MRILLLTQWFEPEPTFKGLLFARELAAQGHDVEVLTGFPNYPGGHVYPGYRIRPWVREQIDGISILRVALYPSHDKSGFRRALNYVSFAISAAVIGTALVRKPDVVYVYNPPATIGFPAVVLGFLRRVPFVFDICDLWPDTVAVSGMLSSPGALTLLDKWCNFVYGRARHIVVVSSGFKGQLVRRGVAPDKIDIIYNWCDEAAIEPGGADPELASRLGLSGYFNVIFAGTMGTAQALDSVLEAAALCRQTLPNVQFVFVGGGVDRNRLEKKTADLGLTNVCFLPRQPMSAMGAVLGLADVLLVHLKSHPLFSITIPGKTQAYMASGKPVLMAVRGDAAQLVTQSGGGLVCEPEDPRSIAETVARFAVMSPEERHRMGEAGKRYYDEQLSLKAGVTKFEALFARICGVTVSASRHSSQSSACVS
jgi:glycosyltransferase involved in cell wall biosynthesis